MSSVVKHTKAPVDHTSGAAAKPMLLDEVRARIRRLNDSIRTEDTYVGLGATEIEVFLSHLVIA